tara:strand:- start:249 stop:740 length:492 start_codon:yes stop_codon:yes gene_type:complete
LAYSSGKDGELYIDDAATASARVKSWSLNISQETIDTTFLGDTDRTFKEGVRSISGACDIAYYSDATGESDAKTLINKIFKQRTSSTVPGTAAPQAPIPTSGSNAGKPSFTKLKLGFKNHIGTLQYFEVEVLFTSMSITCAQGEIFTASGSFEVNGAPTEVSV